MGLVALGASVLHLGRPQYAFRAILGLTHSWLSREIVGFGEGLVGRLLMLDARSMRFETLRYAWDPGNPLSGEHPTITDLSLHA